MRTFWLFFALFCSACSAASTLPNPQIVKLKSVPFNQVKISDGFWSPRRETNRRVSIPHSLKMLENAGNIKNFDLAAAGEHEGYSGPVYMDSDLYKALEAASCTLATNPDPALEKQIDAIIAKIAAAQMSDGYVDTHFQVNAPEKRWTNLRDWHELYCTGHMIEAAVANYQATGKRTFLNVAIKAANYVDSVFGDGPGKRMGYPGHPELELALIKLWRVTGDDRYFRLSRFFIENRGSKFFATEHNTPIDRYDGTYWQDNLPIKEQNNIVGHAVRAGYLLSGATDVAAETRDPDLLNAINRIWRNTTEKRMFVTGGIGPSASNEGFTTDYDLPNSTAYQETCASVAMAMWNERLALLYGDSRYADIMETALYNGILAGVSLDGTKFFYVNPLSSLGDHHRSDWFGCACCPPNVTRTLASLGGYAYATSAAAVWVNLYIQGSVTCQVSGKKIALNVTSEYPWDGAVRIKPEVIAPAKFGLRLRVPGWCRGESVKINGKPVAKPTHERGYIVLDREWKAGDVVDLNLPMPVRRVEANPEVKEDVGRLAIQRGPLIYCLEGCDQSVPIESITLPLSARLTIEKRPTLLGGVVVIKGMGETKPDTDWASTLYRTATPPSQTPIMAVPYYAWDNRAACQMRVWLP